MPAKKKKSKKAPKKGTGETADDTSDLLGADLQSVGGSSVVSRSVFNTSNKGGNKKKGAIAHGIVDVKRVKEDIARR